MKKLFVAALLSLVLPAVFAEPPLYETGPAQDSSFVRFLNASDDKLSVMSSDNHANIALTTQGEGRVTRFYPVKAGAKLLAHVQIGGKKFPVEVVAKPGEFVTVAIVYGGSGPQAQLLRETPTDYNAMRASVALLNLDEKCSSASMSGGAKNTGILDQIKPFGMQRRLINPINLSVQLQCDGKNAAGSLDMAQLQAGERYSVILWTSKKGRQAFFVRDTTL
jgi:alginate O-acetyltransferase complex protein AlgF